MIGKLTTLFVMIAAMSAYSDCNSYKPVCGSNHVTYQNACMCQKAKVTVSYGGSCHRRRQYKPLSSYKWNNNITGNSKWDWNTWSWAPAGGYGMSNWNHKYGNKVWAPNSSQGHGHSWSKPVHHKPAVTYMTNDWSMPAWDYGKWKSYGHGNGHWKSWKPANASAWTLPSYPSSWSNTTTSWKTAGAPSYKSWSSPVVSTHYTIPKKDATTSWSSHGSNSNWNAGASNWSAPAKKVEWNAGSNMGNNWSNGSSANYLVGSGLHN